MPAKKAKPATESASIEETVVTTEDVSSPTAPKTPAKKTTKKAVKSHMAPIQESSVIIDTGIITEAAQLDDIRVSEQNVRNWDSYRLEVQEVSLESPGEEFPRKDYQITINAGEVIPEIGQLWQSLFSRNEETGEYSYTVLNPLVLTLNEDGSKTPVSGNTRTYLAQQLKQLTESGQFPYPIRYEIPYTVRAGMSATETALAQINTNNGVGLTLFEQYDVLAMIANGDVEKFRDVANSIYPRYSGQGNRFARLYEKSLNGFPVDKARLFVPNLDTALQVYTDWEKLAREYPSLETVCPKAEINKNCNEVSGNHNFTAKYLPELDHFWKTRLVESGVMIPGFGGTEEAPAEDSEKEEKYYPPAADTWNKIDEAYGVAVAAMRSDAHLDTDENTQAELAKLAAQLEKTFRKFNDLLHPKPKKSDEPVKEEKEPKPKKEKKSAPKAPKAAANDGPAPLPPELMQRLEEDYQAMEETFGDTPAPVQIVAEESPDVAAFDAAISQLDL